MSLYSPHTSEGSKSETFTSKLSSRRVFTFIYIHTHTHLELLRQYVGIEFSTSMYCFAWLTHTGIAIHVNLVISRRLASSNVVLYNNMNELLNIYYTVYRYIGIHVKEIWRKIFIFDVAQMTFFYRDNYNKSKNIDNHYLI